MAGSINKVILVGNLGTDPEVRAMQSGDRVANLSIATSESWKGKDGERQERTQWHRVVLFNQALVGVAERYLKKGSKVYIEGQLETRKWTDQNGQEKYTTEVVLRPYRGELTMLDSRGQGGDSFNDNYQDGGMPQGGGFAPAAEAGGMGGGGAAAAPAVDTMEDEIPF